MIRACQTISGTRPRRFGRWALAATLCGLLAACSLNPFGDDEQEAAQMGGATYARASDYPNLAGVPSEAPRPTSDDLRDTLTRGLIADRANARYTDEALTAESTAVPPAPSPPKGQQRVDISWETPRVVPEGQETEAAEGVEIEWETARVEPAEAPVAEATADEPAAVPGGGKELLAVIYFASESPELNDEDHAVLRDVLLKQEEIGGRLHLVSHGASFGEGDDPVAQRMVDLDLSLKRANAVATMLMDLGAAQDKLLIEAKAEAHPAAGEAGSDDAAGDRKVEIFLEY